ncbi:MAG: Type 1 glutamine amidotransferase-like domain-containing protein [Dehalococcoidia bacterium]
MGLQPFRSGLGFIRGSHSPHYDSEPERRPLYQRLVAEGTLPSGYAVDDYAALHFVDGQLAHAVSSRRGARAFRVERSAGDVIETAIEPEPLQ